MPLRELLMIMSMNQQLVVRRLKLSESMLVVREKESVYHRITVLRDKFRKGVQIAQNQLLSTYPSYKESTTYARFSVAEHNVVALNVICRLGPIDPSLKVSFEFSQHPFFATAVVKRH
ncbi:hypothetical protein ACFE04_024363 [Oxalis oulophora]